MRWLAAACAGCILGGLAAAQDAATFDRAAAAAAADDRGGAAARALAAFLQLPDGAERAARLAPACQLAFRCGDVRVALQLAEEAGRRGLADADTAMVRLRCRAAAGDLAAFVADATAALSGPHAAAVAAALAAEEHRLLPAADRLLRTGATATGLWVFAQLAALEPPSGVRLANLALAQRCTGDTAAAAATYRLATRLLPDDPSIWNDYALLVRATEGLDAALPLFDRSRRAEPTPGDGPAITGQVMAELAQPGCLGGDPLPSAAAALRLRPDAAMLRRVCLDLILSRQRQEQPPDIRASTR